MIKDIELIIGRKIRGLKNAESINLDSCIAMLKNTSMLKNNWSYAENVEIEYTELKHFGGKVETHKKTINQATIKNGTFEAKIEFNVDNLIMLGKRMNKIKFSLPEIKPAAKVKAPKAAKKAVNVKKPAINIHLNARMYQSTENCYTFA